MVRKIIPHKTKREYRRMQNPGRKTPEKVYPVNMLASNQTELKAQLRKSYPNRVAVKITKGDLYPTSGRYAHIRKYWYTVVLKARKPVGRHKRYVL